MIKLLAIDMDKTCLNDSNLISDNALETLRMLASDKIMIIPTTGRALDCLPHQLLNEDFYQYCISSNGAIINDLKNNICIHKQEINHNLALSFLNECINLNIGIDIHINNHFLLQGKIFHLIGKMVYGKDANRAMTCKSIIEYLKKSTSNVEEIQIYFFSQKTKQKIHEILLKYQGLSYAFSDHYVEIFSKDTSKGMAINVIAKILNIKKEEIACIGDGENDLSMFEVSGLRFAMGNAEDILKNKADIILPSNNDDGICHIYKYILEYN